MTKRTPEDDPTGSLFRMLEDKLELERKFGVDVVPTPKKDASEPAAPAPREGEGRGTDPERSRGGEGTVAEEAPPQAKEPAKGVPDDASKADKLAALEAELTDCQECSLGATRTNLVFGVGSPDADILFIGEAPGADEDAQGEPFVGRAGKLLDKIIDAMGLKRTDVYIGNILKCRPPGNRNPRPSEIIHCLPFLKEQIRIIEPGVIVCLGGVAAQTLLQTTMPVGRMRGTFQDFLGIPLLVTFHPAYLLRTPSGKAAVWEDMRKVLHKLGLPIPER